jgi:peptidoglycan-N-acetylglucosamine deacetylase
MSKMDLGIVTLVLIYVIIPNLRFRVFSNEVIKRASTKEKVIALTFDDGPDPRYTPKLLDVLKRYDVKSTFFVLAEKAHMYPELIQRIMDEGHHIGLHSFKHMNAIFLLPNQTKREFADSVRIMNKLGVKVKYFRPPWGMFNPLTFYYAKLHNLKVVLWSVHASDWSRWVNVDYIKNRLINKVRPGDIVLLHDGRGAKDAPQRTINALETVLPALKQKGYRFVLAKDL